MKKGLLIAVLFLSFSLTAFAQSPVYGEDNASYEVTEEAPKTDYVTQNPETVQNDSAKGAHPYDLEQNQEVAPEFAHWSLIGHVGFNMFDGDFTSEMLHNIAVPSAGLAIEYSFTTVWGMGIEYMYDMYTVTGRPNSNNADTLLHGHMHKAGAYLTMDLFNLMFPKLQKKIVSISPYLGGGIAFYKRNKVYFDDRYYDAEKRKWINPTHEKGNTLNYVNSEGDYGKPDHDTAYSNIGYLQAGVNVEFNINRSIAVGVRAGYSYFTRDYVDGRGYSMNPRSFASKNNDGIFDITLNVRYKIQPVKYSHERNLIKTGQYEKKELPQQQIQPCHDTIIIRHDSIIVRESSVYEHTEIEKEKENEQYYYVYFDNNKAIINDEGLITIQQVAERLQEDSSLYAIVTGYCDNTGSDKLNYALGDRRAFVVMDELENEHAIDTTRMFGSGRGKVIGRRSTGSYSPNRRTAIRLVDKETFEKMKLNLEEELEQRPEEVKTVPLSESARPEKVNIYEHRTSEGVVTDKNTTLSKLARQYYNNTYCWVYIYIANKDKIANPNALRPGTKLIIPELTQDEMQITKDESLVLFSNARQGK